MFKKWILLSYSLLGKSSPFSPPSCGTSSPPCCWALVRDGSRARNAVSGAVRAAQGDWGWAGAIFPTPSCTRLSPGPRVAELVLTASQSLLKSCLIFWIYPVTLSGLKTSSESQIKKRHLAISSIGLISSHFPSLFSPLSLLWVPTDISIHELKGKIPSIERGPWLTSSDSCWVNNHSWNQLSQPVTFLKTGFLNRYPHTCYKIQKVEKYHENSS